MSRADAGRLIHLSKKRERAKEDMEQQLKRMEEESSKRAAGISSKFTANYDAVEEHLKTKTVGLVTLDEMREKQKDVINDREETVVRGESSKSHKADGSGLNVTADGKVAQRLGMDPTIDTSFLPDKDREAEIERKKIELAAIWKAQQEREKNEEITVAFAYWDGSSHRKNLKVKKGHTISQFLTWAIEVVDFGFVITKQFCSSSQVLKKEFTELKTSVAENLMFVKEDLIIPHFYTFQDFIVTKAMGKTGPLYEFDAAGDVRIRQDAALDCGEAHPAKVVLRSWYEKNKHIYPASRWEPFVPNKKYGRTIDDLSTI
ncbi:XAP5 protein [Teladorsagia circumcincta]|uniref:Protein FAM50 homolog n=1 Tax=Teladorsagia circumcincta TaxID=45464 RepID=A0A2G9UD43_TELCI|nr:XAP5 protein [Teladorsagia circumcincta]